MKNLTKRELKASTSSRKRRGSLESESHEERIESQLHRVRLLCEAFFIFLNLTKRELKESDGGFLSSPLNRLNLTKRELKGRRATWTASTRACESHEERIESRFSWGTVFYRP